jgi:hypothetical protein
MSLYDKPARDGKQGRDRAMPQSKVTQAGRDNGLFGKVGLISIFVIASVALVVMYFARPHLESKRVSLAKSIDVNKSGYIEVTALGSLPAQGGGDGKSCELKIGIEVRDNEAFSHADGLISARRADGSEIFKRSLTFGLESPQITHVALSALDCETVKYFRLEDFINFAVSQNLSLTDEEVKKLSSSFVFSINPASTVRLHLSEKIRTKK